MERQRKRIDCNLLERKEQKKNTTSIHVDQFVCVYCNSLAHKIREEEKKLNSF